MNHVTVNIGKLISKPWLIEYNGVFPYHDFFIGLRAGQQLIGFKCASKSLPAICYKLNNGGYVYWNVDSGEYNKYFIFIRPLINNEIIKFVKEFNASNGHNINLHELPNIQRLRIKL